MSKQGIENGNALRVCLMRMEYPHLQLAQLGLVLPGRLLLACQGHNGSPFLDVSGSESAVSFWGKHSVGALLES